jgi:hypothetical protein
MADWSEEDWAAWDAKVDAVGKKAKEQDGKKEGVAEGPGFDKWANDRAESQLHKLKPGMVRDRKTGKWYDPNKEFDKKMNSPEVMAQMKRMAQKEGVAEAYQFKGPFPFDVDHMHGGRGINLPVRDAKKHFTNKKQWTQAVNDINSSVYDDNSEYSSHNDIYTVSMDDREWAKWSDAQQKGYIDMGGMSEGVAEGVEETNDSLISQVTELITTLKPEQKKQIADELRTELNVNEGTLKEKWSQKYKDSINCGNPKGFSQKAHCQGKKK